VQFLNEEQLTELLRDVSYPVIDLHEYKKMDDQVDMKVINVL